MKKCPSKPLIHQDKASLPYLENSGPLHPKEHSSYLDELIGNQALNNRLEGYGVNLFLKDRMGHQQHYPQGYHPTQKVNLNLSM